MVFLYHVQHLHIHEEKTHKDFGAHCMNMKNLYMIQKKQTGPYLSFDALKNISRTPSASDLFFSHRISEIQWTCMLSFCMDGWAAGPRRLIASPCLLAGTCCRAVGAVCQPHRPLRPPPWPQRAMLVPHPRPYRKSRRLRAVAAPVVSACPLPWRSAALPMLVSSPASD